MISEVSASLMNLKIITGEQILGYVVAPNEDLMLSGNYKFDKFVYIFYPAKVELAGSNEVKLSTYMLLAGEKCFPISFNDVIIGTSINQNGFDLYSQWLERSNLSIDDITNYISYYFSDEEVTDDGVKISEEMATELLSKFTGRTKH